MRLIICVSVLLLGSVSLVFPSRGNALAQAPEVGSIIVIVRANDEVQTPLLGGNVTVRKGAAVVGVVRSDPVDYYVIRSLLPGKYRVTADVPGYQSKTANATVVKYQTIRVEMDLRPAGRRPR